MKTLKLEKILVKNLELEHNRNKKLRYVFHSRQPNVHRYSLLKHKIPTMGFTVLQTWYANYCADTVEWCPVSPYLNYFACGSYQLQESVTSGSADGAPQTRIGQLHLFSVSESLQLECHCTVDCPSGILDCKWYPQRISDRVVFVTAAADGKIGLWELDTVEGETRINPVTELEVNSGHLLLSVDWCSKKTDICVSDSAGCISILRLNEDLTLQLLHKLEIHDNEAWIAAFGFDDIDNIYSGADDCWLKITDLRSGKLVSRIREHSAGVTSIRFCHSKPHVFATGSYDETVKLWDTRNTTKSLSTLNVGGGVWRIKWDPQDAGHILVAGMYSGCFWLKYDSNSDVLTAQCSLEEHSTISYGADICYLKSQNIQNDFKFESCAAVDPNRLHRLIATCSFYDKKLCLSVV